MGWRIPFWKWIHGVAETVRRRTVQLNLPKLSICVVTNNKQNGHGIGYWVLVGIFGFGNFDIGN